MHITLTGKPGGKLPCGRSRGIQDDNIRMVLRKVGWKGVG
jgi:hypothetical protein